VQVFIWSVNHHTLTSLDGILIRWRLWTCPSSTPDDVELSDHIQIQMHLTAIAETYFQYLTRDIFS